MKTCNVCNEIKDLKDFPSNKGYFRKQCKQCLNAHRRAIYNPSPEERAKKVARTRSWEARNLEHVKTIRRKSKWKEQGIDPELAEQYYQNHNGICECCGKKSDYTFHIDHCHSTGLIRGMICSSCNRGIGFLGDNIEGVTKALEYLKRQLPYLTS